VGGKANYSAGNKDQLSPATAAWAPALAIAAAAGVVTAMAFPAPLFFPVLSLGMIAIAALAGAYAFLRPAEQRKSILIFAATLTFIGLAAGMLGDPDHVALLL
jgi:acyl-CoA reductase-like NAD-dependent aldehyde dehydrogenase